MAHELRTLVFNIITEIFENDIVMRTKNYHGGKWDETMKLVIGDLFSSEGVKRIDGKSNEKGSMVTIFLDDGSIIKGATKTFPRIGHVTIKGAHGKMEMELDGRQSINLIGSMKDAWDKYLSAATEASA